MKIGVFVMYGGKMTFKPVDVWLDRAEIEYLLDLVGRDQLLVGNLIGIDVQGNLAEALDRANKERYGRD